MSSVILDGFPLLYSARPPEETSIVERQLGSPHSPRAQGLFLPTDSQKERSARLSSQPGALLCSGRRHSVASQQGARAHERLTVPRPFVIGAFSAAAYFPSPLRSRLPGANSNTRANRRSKRHRRPVKQERAANLLRCLRNRIQERVRVCNNA